MELRRSFVWAGQEFYIPAVYFCREGLVLDLCRKTDPEALRRFADKWGLTPETDDTDLFSPAQQMQMEAEHPLRADLRCLAVMDGQECPAEHSSATTWHPGEEEEDVVRATDDVSSALAEQYELDPDFIWYIERFSLYYRVVVCRAPLQGLCYTVRDVVDWCGSPTTRWFSKGSNHSPLQFC